jgi:RsiW-degrading membrane proteinase PrsW (M82 family)
MGLFAEPNLLDIIVSLLIGLIAGGLITSLIFILIIKKRWEMKWEYLNKIKVNDEYLILVYF